MDNEEKKKSNWKIIHNVINIVLTLAIVCLSYVVYDLNRNIENRDKSVLEGRKYALVYDTRAFLVDYITNLFRYLAFEHDKVLTTKFRSIHSDKGPETPTISRRYYVDYPYLSRCLECNFLYDNAWPEKQNDIELYFRNNPSIKPLDPGILDPIHTKLYLDLKTSVDELNSAFNKIAPKNKEAEEYWIKKYLEEEITDKIIWSTITIYDRNRLIDLIEVVRHRGDIFLDAFPELDVKAIKFIMEIESSTPFVKELGKSHFDKKPTPVKNATIYLDDNTYRFDYFKYFVISIKKQLEEHETKVNKEAQSDKVILPETTNYRIINQ